MEKSLLVGCDEFTIVLHLDLPVDAEEWEERAEEFIQEFIERSKMEELFGRLVVMNSKVPAGYTKGWTVENVPWYFAMAMHEHFQTMGVCVRFSAEAWAWYQKVYRERFVEEINVASFYQMVQSDVYETRITRIDLTADYYNYDDALSPDNIFNSLIDQKVLVMDCNNRVARRRITHYGKDGVTESILIGSKKENTKSVCRIYDKRLEQISKSGFRLEEALSCEAWTRFEASYRGKYAWQIAEDLLLIGDEVELSQYIASKISDKYRFYSVSDDDYTGYTNDLLDIVGNAGFSSLRSEAPRDNSLWQSIQYIMHGSGLYSTMYKIGCIWGDAAEIKFMQMLYEIYRESYVPTLRDDNPVHRWLALHYESLHGMDLEDCFYKKNIN